MPILEGSRDAIRSGGGQELLRPHLGWLARRWTNCPLQAASTDFGATEVSAGNRAARKSTRWAPGGASQRHRFHRVVNCRADAPFRGWNGQSETSGPTTKGTFPWSLDWSTRDS